MKREVDISDLKKIEEVLHECYMHFLHRDEMNGRIHLAKKMVQSPITTATQRAWERIDKIIQGDQVIMVPND